MIRLSAHCASMFIVAMIAAALFAGCTFPVRTGYDRSIGDYKPAPTAKAETANETAAPPQTAPAPAASPAAQAHQTTASAQKNAAAHKMAAPPPQKPRGGLEDYARSWLGAKYVYGAAEKKRTDCSGFVMQVYKGYYNIALDHSSSGMFKDSRGSKVSRGSLKEGDLVFFGSFWKIDHVGIYLNGDRFIHASTSKGVMISPMNDKYWSPKYQGGRRFK